MCGLLRATAVAAADNDDDDDDNIRMVARLLLVRCWRSTLNKNITQRNCHCLLHGCTRRLLLPIFNTMSAVA